MPVRGNPRRRRADPDRCGSIPACAGEPNAGPAGQWLSRVYPRMCGGTRRKPGLSSSHRGLSPHVRGNQAVARTFVSSFGSIPACAGEPKIAKGNSRLIQVYPRMCGGTFRSCPMSASVLGLSPHVRGNQHRRREADRRHGSIPACAGEPSSRQRRRGEAGVYPRMCGGTSSLAARRKGSIGLSPHVRGNRGWPTAGDENAGSIPACAGEPLRKSLDTSLARVYPRMCGGTYIGLDSTGAFWGLSPHVRGNP